MAEEGKLRKDKAVVVDDTEEENGSAADIASVLQKLSLGRKKKLLVFNLKGFLIYRAFRYNKKEIPRNRRADARYGNHLVFKRPFLDEFLEFCFKRFEIGIWSSAQEHNVHGFLDCAIGKYLRSKLLFVWDQRQCTDTGFKTLEDKRKPLFLKELEKLWETLGTTHQYSASDTLLIDDNPYKALLNPAYTGIFPRAYDPDDANDNGLDPKGELCEFLDGLAEAEDVTEYVKVHTFGQPAITDTHDHWDFYSGVLRLIQNKKTAVDEVSGAKVVG